MSSNVLSARRWVRALGQGIVLEEEDENHAIAYTTTGNAYELDWEEMSCSCPDHEDRGTSCKHLRAWFAKKYDL